MLRILSVIGFAGMAAAHLGDAAADAGVRRLAGTGHQRNLSARPDVEGIRAECTVFLRRVFAVSVFPEAGAHSRIADANRRITIGRCLKTVTVLRLILVALAAFTAGGLAAFTLRQEMKPAAFQSGKALIGGPFVLTNHRGERVVGQFEKLAC